jgi:hypothetical protein
MRILLQKTAIWLPAAAALLLTVGFAPGQDVRPPLLQDIDIKKAAPSASPPLVQKTSSAGVVDMVPTSSIRTLFPALAEVSKPGYSGILVESLDGSVVLESNAGFTFNPASNVKIATAYAVLKTFGPEFRFLTSVYTDGTLDRSTGTLNGNLYVSGKDPIFGNQHAVTLAHELNKMGISSVSGDLIVTDNFVMNYAGSPLASAHGLLATLDASKRSPGFHTIGQTSLPYPANQPGSGRSERGFHGSGVCAGYPEQSNHALHARIGADARDLKGDALLFEQFYGRTPWRHARRRVRSREDRPS